MSQDEGITRKRPEALHHQIAVRIRQEVADRALPAHSKLASEIVLAQQYGVSRGTVTKALDTLVREGGVYRRQPHGTFVAPGARGDTAAQSHAATSTRADLPTVGLVVPYLPESFVGSIILGVENVTRAIGYGLIFAHSENDRGLERYHIEQFVQRKVAGILLFPVTSRRGDEHEPDDVDAALSAELRALQRRRMPFVLIDRYDPGLDCDYIVSDDVAAGYAATQHLVALGRRRIGFLSTAPHATSAANRYKGYLRCLREHDLPVEERLTERAAPGMPVTPLTAHTDTMALRAYLHRPERATAVVAVNEYMGLRLLQAAEDAGLAVPDDLAIVCCGPGDVGAHARVPLTSIVQPAADLGRQAAHVLMDRIASRATDPRHVTLPVSLIVRRSCGAGSRAVAHTIPSRSRGYETDEV